MKTPWYVWLLAPIIALIVIDAMVLGLCLAVWDVLTEGNPDD